MNRPSVIFIDVDDTLVRSVGSTRIPMPEVIRQVRRLHENGHMCFTSGAAVEPTTPVAAQKNWAYRNVSKHFYPNQTPISMIKRYTNGGSVPTSSLSTADKSTGNLNNSISPDGMKMQLPCIPVHLLYKKVV